jgi:hypothetical protein
MISIWNILILDDEMRTFVGKRSAPAFIPHLPQTTLDITVNQSETKIRPNDVPEYLHN